MVNVKVIETVVLSFGKKKEIFESESGFTLTRPEGALFFETESSKVSNGR